MAAEPQRGLLVSTRRNIRNTTTRFPSSLSTIEQKGGLQIDKMLKTEHQFYVRRKSGLINDIFTN